MTDPLHFTDPAWSVKEARRQAIEECAQIAERRMQRMEATLAQGTGTHGQPGYVTDATWGGWLSAAGEAASISVLIRSLLNAPVGSAPLVDEGGSMPNNPSSTGTSQIK